MTKIDIKDISKLKKKELKEELIKTINEDIDMIIRIATSNIFGLLKIRSGARKAINFLKKRLEDEKK